MTSLEKKDQVLDTSPKDKRSDMLVLAACIVSLAVIIFIDTLTPVGVAIGVMYIVPVGLTMFSRASG